jgi:hypothetical protein
LNWIDGLDLHTVTDMNRLSPVREACATGAKQTRGTLFRRLIKLNLEIVRLQRHHDAGRFGHDSSTGTGDLQCNPGRFLSGDLHPMTGIQEPRNHHRFRFAPIQLHLKLISSLK